MKDRMVFIFSAIEWINRCSAFTKGMTVEDFKADLKTQDSVIRNIEILGQSLKDFGIEDRLWITRKFVGKNWLG